MFFSTNALHVCVIEPCTTGTFPIGEAQNGAPLGFDGTSAPVQPSTTAAVTSASIQPSTTGRPQPSTTASLTTAHPQPSTTGRPLPSTTAPLTTAHPLPSTTAPLTTARPQPSTTASITSARLQPSTTGSATTAHPQPSTTASVTSARPQPSTTAVPVAPSTTSSVASSPSMNCAGVSTSSSSQAVITSMSYWGSGYLATIILTINEPVLANWYVEVVYPPNQSNGNLVGAYDSASLLCQNSHSAILQAASWAKNVPAGTQLTIEISGNNVENLSSDAIQQNTVIRVYSS